MSVQSEYRNLYKRIRLWKRDKFLVELFDTNKRFEMSQHKLAYLFYSDKKLVFAGSDYGCSPMVAIDSNECLGALLSFLSLRKGDTDKEYFDDYTEEQLEFSEQYGEELSMWAMELEGSLTDE